MAPRPASPSARRRAINRLAAAGAGVVLAVAGLSLVWPRADRVEARRELNSVADLAKVPSRPVTVLVIGSDAQRPADQTNGAAPLGPANSDALLLLRVQPAGPLQVLEIPIEAAVQLPGQKRPQALGSLYRQGGVALVGDAVRELVQLPQGQPDRYVVLGRAALRSLIDGLGKLDVSPSRPIRYADRAQKLSIALDAGLQQLDGQQVEQLVRYRDPAGGEEGRRQQQQQVLRALVRDLAQPDRLPLLTPLARHMLGLIETNLSEGELLSLMAAGLSQPEAIDVTSLPLEPADPRHKTMRQLAAADALPAAWRQPLP